ncbi:MAG: hypothetical protein JNM85_08205 [Chthonomonas sp.]|nr:hypothetical protein [Chthonomonas sp.]
MRTIGWSAIALATLTMVGCSKPAPDFVGVWKETTAKGIQHEIVMYTDGTYVDRTFKHTNGERLEVRGTYQYRDEKLYAKPSEFSLENMSDARKKEMAKTLPPDLLKQDVGTVKWPSKDEWHFSPIDSPKEVAIYKRIAGPTTTDKAKSK